MTPSLARRLAGAALLLGVLGDALFDRTALGINVPTSVAIILVAITGLGRGRATVDPMDLWLPVIAIVAALGAALRTDPQVVGLDLALASIATLAWGFAVAGERVTRRTAAAAARLGAWALASLTVGGGMIVARAGADGAIGRSFRSIGRFSPVARGLVVALPVVALFAILLASADAVFNRLVEDLINPAIDLSEPTRRGAFAFVAAWAVGGPLAIATGALPIHDDAGRGSGGGASRATGEASAGWGLQQLPRLGATEMLTVLVAVDVLFATFVALQIAYLFRGADTLVASGVTYSDYARQGYFELVAVVGLAGLLLIIVEAATGRTRRFVLAAFGLLALTTVILASAAFRLRLYQVTYGWTELRFYVAASMAWLAVCGAVATVLLTANRMRWLPHGLAIAAVAVTLAVSALGPQAFVASQDLARALDPSLVPAGGKSGLDVDYVATLGDDAVPSLVAALDRLPPAERTALLLSLRLRRDDLAADGTATGWPAWNLSRERAREALADLPPQ
jgi:Domain of unknown function (DUF4173)